MVLLLIPADVRNLHPPPPLIITSNRGQMSNNSGSHECDYWYIRICKISFGSFHNIYRLVLWKTGSHPALRIDTIYLLLSLYHQNLTHPTIKCFKEIKIAIKHIKLNIKVLSEMCATRFGGKPWLIVTVGCVRARQAEKLFCLPLKNLQ